MEIETRIKVCPRTFCEYVPETRVRCVPQTVCETQTIQCVRRVPYTVCKQVPETKVICVPETIVKPVTVCKTICEPRTICKQVPVEVCVPVPVIHRCPDPVLASPQVPAKSILATEQSLPLTTIPACGSCDSHHLLFGRMLGSKKRLF
jgi:hypothetical protein